MPYYPPSGSASSSSSGLAGTGNYYLLTSDGGTLLPNSLVIVPGSSVTSHITGSNYYVNAVTSGGASSVSFDKDFFFYRPIGTNNAYSQKTIRYVTPYSFIDRGYTSGITYQVDTAMFLPFVVTRSGIISEIAFVTIATGIDSIVQVGIYTNSSNNVLYPFQAIATSGIMSGTNVNVVQKFFTTQTLTSNTLYWLAINIGTSGTGLIPHQAISFFPLLQTSSNPALDGVEGSYLRLVRPFSNGLPAQVETGGLIASAGAITLPWIGVAFTA